MHPSDLFSTSDPLELLFLLKETNLPFLNGHKGIPV